jgi:hypothetical protein
MRSGIWKIVAALILAGSSAYVAPVAGAEPRKDPKAQPEMKLPPGWTEDDMKACMLAATPGKMHEMDELDRAKLDVKIAEIRLEMAINQWNLRQDEVAAKRARMDEKKRQESKH